MTDPIGSSVTRMLDILQIEAHGVSKAWAFRKNRPPSRPYTVVGIAPNSARAFSPAEIYLTLPVGTTDGLTITVVVATMMAVVVAATYLPASRAATIDPMLTLRQDGRQSE